MATCPILWFGSPGLCSSNSSVCFALFLLFPVFGGVSFWCHSHFILIWPTLTQLDCIEWHNLETMMFSVRSVCQESCVLLTSKPASRKDLGMSHFNPYCSEWEQRFNVQSQPLCKNTSLYKTAEVRHVVDVKSVQCCMNESFSCTCKVWNWLFQSLLETVTCHLLYTCTVQLLLKTACLLHSNISKPSGWLILLVVNLWCSPIVCVCIQRRNAKNKHLQIPSLLRTRGWMKRAKHLTKRGAKSALIKRWERKQAATWGVLFPSSSSLAYMSSGVKDQWEIGWASSAQSCWCINIETRRFWTLEGFEIGFINMWIVQNKDGSWLLIKVLDGHTVTSNTRECLTLCCFALTLWWHGGWMNS